MHCVPIVHLKLTLKCPQVLDSQQRDEEKGNLYCAAVLEAMVIKQEAELKDKVASHTMKTSVWLCLEGVDYVLVCLYKLQEGEFERISEAKWYKCCSDLSLLSCKTQMQ
jgi:hypothetical protein